MIALVGRALALAALGVLLGYTSNALRAGGVSLAGFEAPASCGGTAAIPPPVTELDAAVATRMLASVDGPHAAESRATDAGADVPRTLVLDARDERAYELGHVDGALHLPCAAGNAAAEHIVELATGYDRVIVYGDAVTDAHTLAAEIAHRLDAHVAVHVVTEGFAGLQRAGVPAASGACERCLERSEAR